MTGQRRPVFRLPSLDLASGFEAPVVPARLPHEVTSGSDPALAVVEGAYRPGSTVCRFVQPHGLVALRVLEPPAVLRVVLTVRSDRASDERWTERAVRSAAARAVRGVDRDGAESIADPAGRVRAIGVSAYGRPRGAVLLLNDPAPEAWTRQRVAFDVAADELEAGMLLLGFDSADGPADALSDGLVGVCLTRIRVLASDGRGQGSVSTGLSADGDGWLPYGPAGAVITPVDQRDLFLQARLPAAGRGRFRPAQVRPSPALEILDGPGPAGPVVAISTVDGIATYRLPGDRGPLRVAFTDPGAQPPGEFRLRMGPPSR